MTQESPETTLLKMAFRGLTGPIKLPPTPSPYWNPPSLFDVRDVEFETDIPGIGKGGRRPDVTLVDVDGRRMAVELCNTNRKSADWVRDLDSVGMLVIEVDVRNNTPDLGAPSRERVSKLLRNAKWLNPGPDGNVAKSVLEWVPYTNILSYFQVCETGFILERDGKEVAIKILFEKGRWQSVVGNSQMGEMRTRPAEAAQDAWEAAHPASYPYPNLPPCPTVIDIGTGIDLDEWGLWTERWGGKWLGAPYQCAACLGVIPSFGLVLNLGALVDGRRIPVISYYTFKAWEGKAMSLYLKHQPDKHYCWVCAAAVQTADDWKPHIPGNKTAGEPPGFEEFCKWKSAQAEERRRASYERMPPSHHTDTHEATTMLKDIEDFIAKGDLDTALETLPTLRAYGPEGRARARQCAQQIVQGWFRQLPRPLQHTILQ